MRSKFNKTHCHPSHSPHSHRSGEHAHPAPRRTDFKPPTILFEDPQIIVLSKPPGLLSQGDDSQEPNLVDWLREYLGRTYVGLIHRLDRNTSGIMIVAKRSKAAQRLSEDLKNNRLSRSYLAWVEGALQSEVKWTHVLTKDSDKNKVKVITRVGNSSAPSQTSLNGKLAVLQAVPLKTILWKGHLITLTQFELETGRSHQIRVQAAYEKYPLLGDMKYGSADANLPFHRPALHSSRLEFVHPISKKVIAYEDPLPEDLQLKPDC